MSNRLKLLILFAALLLLRLPALFHPILDADEAIYGLFSRIWFDGGIPYVNAVETKPLGIYFFFGLIFELFGRYNMLAVHMATIIIVGLTAYIIYLMAEMIYSKAAGFWAALLYLVFSTTYIPKVIATTIEPVMLLPVCLQFYYWLRYEKDENWRYAFLSGLFFATACCFKYQAGMNLFILLAYLIFVKRRIPLKAAGQFLIGAVIPPAIMMLYIYRAGALDGFIYWNIKGNANYISEGTAALDLGKRILTRVAPYMASTALIWILAFTRIYRLCHCERPSGAKQSHAQGIASPSGLTMTRAPEWLMVIWLVLSIIPVSAGYRFYGHYFLLMLPPMAILASSVAVSAFERPWPRRLIVFWMLLPAIGFTIARLYISDVHKAVHEDNLDDYRPLAAYVSLKTSPDDTILAWGYAPCIYWYSERKPATRFFWSDVLTGRVPGLKDEMIDSDRFVNRDAWNMFWEDIEKSRPVYIIDTAPAGLHSYKNYPISRYPELMDYVKKNYKEEVRLNGAVFYRRNSQ